MENFDWQLTYLHCFYHVVQSKFQNFAEKDTIERIRFLSTAYNRGFHCSKEEIERWFKYKNFPYGETILGEMNTQYNYADIAIDFYKSQTIF